MTGAFIARGLEDLLGTNGSNIIESITRQGPGSGRHFHKIIIELNGPKLKSNQYFDAVRILSAENPDRFLYDGEMMFLSDQFGFEARNGVPDSVYITIVVNSEGYHADRHRPEFVEGAARAIQAISAKLFPKKPELSTDIYEAYFESMGGELDEYTLTQPGSFGNGTLGPLPKPMSRYKGRTLTPAIVKALARQQVNPHALIPPYMPPLSNNKNPKIGSGPYSKKP